MPTLKILRRKHPDYCPEQWGIFKALYSGGNALTDLARKLFNRLSFESPTQFADRLAHAPRAFEGHLANCIDQARNQLFSSPFQIQTRDRASLAPFYLDFQECAALNGSNLEHFARERFTQALTFGRAYWLVSFPNAPDPAPISELDWIQSDAGRAYVKPINVQDVTNWEADDNGDLLWVIIGSKSLHAPDPFSDAEHVRETFQVIDRERIETYVIEYAANKPPKEKDSPELVGSHSHNLGQVPLVSLNLQAEDLALMPRAYQAMIHHWSLNNALSIAQLRTCIPQQVIKSDALLQDSPEDGKRRADHANYAVIIGSTDDIKLVTPDSGSFQFQLQRIDQVKQEIYRLCNFAGVAAREPKERAQSGVAKQHEAALTEVALKSYGVLVKAAIEKTLNLVAAGRGEDLNFEVTGLDSFTVAIQGITIADAKELLALPMGETFHREVKSLLSLKVLPGTAEVVKQEIRKELEAMAEQFQPQPQLQLAPAPDQSVQSTNKLAP